MSFKTIRIHPAAPPKPALGAACNGCGVCCAMETCPPARLIFWRRSGPCPALLWGDEERRYRCGLMLAPRRYLRSFPRVLESSLRRLFARWIAAGKGCDADAELLADEAESMP